MDCHFSKLIIGWDLRRLQTPVSALLFLKRNGQFHPKMFRLLLLALFGGLLNAGTTSAQTAAAGSSATVDLSFPNSLAGLDSANGWGPFRFGARWSDWPATVQLLPEAQNGQVSGVVTRYGLLVGGVWLAGVRLDAYNGRLATLWFGLSSEADAEELLAQLRARFGQGQTSGYNTVTWPGAVVSLVYEPLIIARGSGRNVRTTTLGRLGLRSNALQAQAVADKAAVRAMRHAAR